MGPRRVLRLRRSLGRDGLVAVFFLVTLVVAAILSAIPLPWGAAPYSWEAISQGLVFGLIVASIATPRGRKGLQRISRTLKNKPRYDTR